MKSLVMTLAFLMMASVHIWTVVLAFQVNGISARGWLVASICFTMPGLAEIAWGIWAVIHGHPFVWGALAFFLLAALVVLSGKSIRER